MLLSARGRDIVAPRRRAGKAIRAMR